MTFQAKKLALTLVPFTCCAALLLASACAHNPAPAPASPSASASQATAPDAEKTRKHLQAHVHYPASRAEILAACAQTPEFTASEKQWFSNSLPDRTYASADEVLQVLGI